MVVTRCRFAVGLSEIRVAVNSKGLDVDVELDTTQAAVPEAEAGVAGDAGVEGEVDTGPMPFRDNQCGVLVRTRAVTARARVGATVRPPSPRTIRETPSSNTAATSAGSSPGLSMMAQRVRSAPISWAASRPKRGRPMIAACSPAPVVAATSATRIDCAPVTAVTVPRGQPAAREERSERMRDGKNPLRPCSRRRCGGVVGVVGVGLGRLRRRWWRGGRFGVGEQFVGPVAGAAGDGGDAAA